MNLDKSPSRLPHSETITRYVSETYIGIQTIALDHSIIGYVHSGVKTIHADVQSWTITSESIYYLPSGIYHIENQLGEHQLFEEVVFSFSVQQISHLLSPDQLAQMNSAVVSDVQTSRLHFCKAWPMLCDFFDTLRNFIDSGLHKQDSKLGHLKLYELVYMLLNQDNSPFVTPLCASLDVNYNIIQSVVADSIMLSRSIEEMAELCGMSISKFKNYFEHYFKTSPHRWLIQKRLEYARLYLITTTDTVGDIAMRCQFGNASYFIKRFSETYNITPSQFRKIEV